MPTQPSDRAEGPHGARGGEGDPGNVVDRRSPAFSANTTMPPKYTRDGDNLPPPLEWSDVPDGTVELASRATQWPDDFGHDGYDGPQPPVGGDPHRYFFRLFALDVPVTASSGDLEELRETLEEHHLATGTLVGLYAR